MIPAHIDVAIVITVLLGAPCGIGAMTKAANQDSGDTNATRDSNSGWDPVSCDTDYPRVSRELGG